MFAELVELVGCRNVHLDCMGTDVAEAQPLWMGVLGVCLGITGSFFSTLSLLIIKWSTTKERGGYSRSDFRTGEIRIWRT